MYAFVKCLRSDTAGTLLVNIYIYIYLCSYTYIHAHTLDKTYFSLLKRSNSYNICNVILAVAKQVITTG
jgi:hypothetical protein